MIRPSTFLPAFILFALITTVARAEPERRNNHTWDLLFIDKQNVEGKRTFAFSTPTTRWIYIGTRAKSWGGAFRVSVDDQSDILVFQDGESDTREAMRHLPAGDHTLTLHAGGTAKLYHMVVRSVPEILMHNLTDKPFDLTHEIHTELLERHVIPPINTFLVPRALVIGDHPLVPLFEKYRDSGRRWLAGYAAFGTPDVGGDSFSVDEALEFITGQEVVNSPLVHGTICDEFTGYNDVSYSNYAEAYRRLKASPEYRDKLFYIYVGNLYGNEPGRDLAASIVETGGLLAWERYLTTKSSESAAREHLDEVLTKQGQAYRDNCPGSIEHMAVCFGFFSRPGGHMANMYPGVNHKVYLDMQFHVVANDPVFKDVYGLMGYHSGYSDEETLRWMAHLFRHYGIEGRTDRATDDPYVSPHLVNGDFVDGLAGWMVDAAGENSVRAVTQEGLGFLQARDGKPQGDTAVVLTRSKNQPNRISQELQDLEPGRLYAFHMMVGDFGDLSNGQTAAVQVQFGKAVQLGDKSHSKTFHNPPHRKVPPYDGEETKAWWTYHRHLFRARSDTAKVTISDWAGLDNPGGPTGQEIVMNYIQVHPYFASE